MALGAAVNLWRKLIVKVETHSAGGTLTLRPQGVLFHATIPPLDEALIDQLAANPDSTRLIIDLQLLGRIEYTGALSLRSAVEEARLAGLEVTVSGVPANVRKTLIRIWEAALEGEPATPP